MTRAIGGTWVTDMRHFLDASGALPEDLPGPALHLGLFLGAIVAWVTSGRSSADPRTNVACRRSPRRRRCAGEIVASLEVDGSTIVWRCPACGDNGVTRGWQGTPWDRRGSAVQRTLLVPPPASIRRARPPLRGPEGPARATRRTRGPGGPRGTR